MTSGNLIYRCRLCGAEYVAFLAANLAQSLDSLATIRRCDAIGLFDIHDCPDGRKGFAEIAGGEVVETAGE